MKTRPSAIIIKDRKILTLKYTYSNQVLYALPGGNLEDNETLKDTLQRELEEELLIKTEVGTLICVSETYNPSKNANTLHLTFTATIIDGIPTPNPEHTTSEGVAWIDVDHIGSLNLYPDIKNQIQKVANGNVGCTYLGRLDQKWI